jgi:hypothetical protein
MMKMYFVISALLALTGCASVTGSKMQPVSVQTVQDGKEVSGAACTLTNDVGKWFVTTPGSVTINKSTGDLTVECKKEGNLAGHEMVVSKANGSVWGNIILGGGIGYIVDRNTGAGFDYPNSITVFLLRMGEALGLAPTTTQAPAQ